MKFTEKIDKRKWAEIGALLGLGALFDILAQSGGYGIIVCSILSALHYNRMNKE